MSDTEIRQLERELANTNDPEISEKLDALRQRSGLPSLFDDLLEQQAKLTQKITKEGPTLLERKLQPIFDKHSEVLNAISWHQENQYNDETYNFSYSHIRFSFRKEIVDLLQSHSHSPKLKFEGRINISADYDDDRMRFLLEEVDTDQNGEIYYSWSAQNGPLIKRSPIIDALSPEVSQKIKGALTDLSKIDGELESASDTLDIMFGRDIEITMRSDGKLKTGYA